METLEYSVSPGESESKQETEGIVLSFPHFDSNFFRLERKNVENQGVEGLLLSRKFSDSTGFPTRLYGARLHLTAGRKHEKLCKAKEEMLLRRAVWWGTGESSGF